MERLFSEPLFYIFFIYGISFLAMSGFIIGGISRGTSDTLVSSFYMLVFFGLSHGAAELTDWARFIGKFLGVGGGDLLVYVSQIFLILSFALLLQFGTNLLTYKSERKNLIRSIPFVLLAIYLGIVFLLGITDILKVGLYARYGFGFTGAALSAVVLFRLGNSLTSAGKQKVVWGLSVIALAFAGYALFGGLIVAPIFGLPIQLFRAICALVIAITTPSILDVFELESRERASADSL